MHLRKKEVYARARAYDKANKPPKISNQEANYLVTLDHGLLDLKHVGKIQIIDPIYFKKILWS